jgi:hypothetical protein
MPATEHAHLAVKVLTQLRDLLELNLQHIHVIERVEIREQLFDS